MAQQGHGHFLFVSAHESKLLDEISLHEWKTAQLVCQDCREHYVYSFSQSYLEFQIEHPDMVTIKCVECGSPNVCDVSN